MFSPHIECISEDQPQLFHSVEFFLRVFFLLFFFSYKNFHNCNDCKRAHFFCVCVCKMTLNDNHFGQLASINMKSKIQQAIEM